MERHDELRESAGGFLYPLQRAHKPSEICLSGRKLYGEQALQSTGIVATTFGQNKAAAPADLRGEKRALCRMKLDVVPRAQSEE